VPEIECPVAQHVVKHIVGFKLDIEKEVTIIAGIHELGKLHSI
jgi:hypothetical protein